MNERKDRLSKQLELNFFEYFLQLPDGLLVLWIDLYNADRISNEARLALEAIEQMSY